MRVTVAAVLTVAFNRSLQSSSHVGLDEPPTPSPDKSLSQCGQSPPSGDR